jgi:hypothetical protein
MQPEHKLATLTRGGDPRLDPAPLSFALSESDTLRGCLVREDLNS